jgi:hypothetical protein
MIQTWYLSNDFQMFVAAIPVSGHYCFIPAPFSRCFKMPTWCVDLQCAILFKWRIWAAYAYLGGLMVFSLSYSAYLFSHYLSTFCDMNICGGYGDGRPGFCSSPLVTDVQVMYYDKPWTRFPP